MHEMGDKKGGAEINRVRNDGNEKKYQMKSRHNNGKYVQRKAVNGSRKTKERRDRLGMRGKK